MSLATYHPASLTSFVNEWVMRNPELICFLANAEALLAWKEEAARRIVARDVMIYSGADVLLQWAAESRMVTE